MTQWKELVSIALLGTEQQKVSELGAAEGPAVEQLLAKLSSAGKSKEAVILSAAGVLSIHGKAGQIPSVHRQAMPDEAPAEDLPVCSITKSQANILLEEHKTNLLPVWLDALAQAGKRIPDMLVPQFLESCAGLKELREHIPPVIGHRGRWLAAQNQNWAYAAHRDVSGASHDELLQVFETGTSEERIAAVQKLRVLDPARTRELVISTWNEDAHQIKASFLEAFLEGLSMDDEPFLEETALNDKRKEVRTKATHLLARLPESRFSKRMEARAIPLLRVGGLLKKSLDVSLPKEVDKEMLRDGFDKPGATIEAADRWGWLYHLLAMIAPKTWEREFKMKPEQILRMESDREHVTYVRNAWRAATTLHQDEQWAEAFCGLDDSYNNADLIAILTNEGRERMILKMIENNKGVMYIHGQEYQQPIMAAMMAAQHDWSVDFGRKLIPALVEEARDGVNYYGKMMFPAIGFYYPSSLLSEISSSFKTIEPETVQYVDKFLSTLKFKSELFATILGPQT